MNETLLIRTKDQRNFVIYKKHLHTLIEFIKTFNAEVYDIEPSSSAEILSPKRLIEAICTNVKTNENNFKIISKLYPTSKKNRQLILSYANEIRSYIEEKFGNGEVVSLKEIKDRYKEFNLTDACLCNHLATVKKKFTNAGYKLIKVSAGSYKIQK